MLSKVARLRAWYWGVLVAEARRIVHQQKGLIVRLRAAGVVHGRPKEHFACSRRTGGALRNTGTFSKVERSYFRRIIVPVLHDKGGAVVFDGPGWREAASGISRSGNGAPRAASSARTLESLP